MLRTAALRDSVVTCVFGFGKDSADKSRRKDVWKRRGTFSAGISDELKAKIMELAGKQP